ncbi:MAG: DoxX [Bacteroidetes bacterium ADurb.Bin217]|nr:MAG: DoxX [Bacteroidetes bacterium ADurb.Bin217]
MSRTIGIVIGICFLLSGIGKLIDIQGFASILMQYNVAFAPTIALSITILEILLGVSYIVYLFTRYIALGSLIFVVCVTGIYTYGLVYHNITQCGCFGVMESGNTNPLLLYSRNLTLILASIYIWKQTRTEQYRYSTLKLSIISIFAILFIGSCIIWNTRIQTNHTHNHSLLYSPIANTFVANYVKPIKEQSYIIFFFSYTCPHCIESIHNLQDYKKHSLVDTIIGFTYTNQKSKGLFMSFFNPDFTIYEIPKEELDEYIDAYPTSFFIKNH